LHFGVALSFPLWMYLHFATVHLWAIQDNKKKKIVNVKTVVTLFTLNVNTRRL